MKITVQDMHQMLIYSYRHGYAGLSFDEISNHVEKIANNVPVVEVTPYGMPRVWGTEEIKNFKEKRFFYHSTEGALAICDSGKRKVALFKNFLKNVPIYLDNDLIGLFQRPMCEITEDQFEKIQPEN